MRKVIDKGYIKSIDGLRAIAVLGVLLTHFGLYKSGWLGVQLFFVISGYLIIGILLDEKKTDNPISFLLKRFYYRRSLRIFPLYYFYLILMVIVYKFFIHDLTSLVSKMPYLLTYTYNLIRINPEFKYTELVNHLWSLCVEEQFYLIFPFLVFFLSKENLKRMFIFILFFSPIFRVGLYTFCRTNNYTDLGVGDIIYVYTPSHFDAFVTGGLIPLFSLNKKINSQFTMFGFATLFVLSGVINAILLKENYFTNLGYGIIGVKNCQYLWSYTIANFFFASIILVLVSEQNSKAKNLISKLLSTKIFTSVGKVSYGIYIYHWVILHFYFIYIRNLTFLGFVLYFLIVFGVSYISYHLFESRFINLKGRHFKLIKNSHSKNNQKT